MVAWLNITLFPSLTASNPALVVLEDTEKTMVPSWSYTLSAGLYFQDVCLELLIVQVESYASCSGNIGVRLHLICHQFLSYQKKSLLEEDMLFPGFFVMPNKHF